MDLPIVFARDLSPLTMAFRPVDGLPGSWTEDAELTVNGAPPEGMVGQLNIVLEGL
jgi:hypothetical protein